MNKEKRHWYETAQRGTSYRTIHLTFLLIFAAELLAPIASLRARSNTSSTPNPLSALTSAYEAPILLATAEPSACVTGCLP